MTVINPNSVAGINSITVQSGNALSVHKSDGTLIRTIAESTGISTFSSISVGSATTTNNADKSINVGLGASISSHANNTLSLGTGGDERLRIDSSGRLLLGTTTEGEATADDFTIGTSTNDAGITIRTNTSGTGRLFFSDGTSGTAEYQGYLQYDHSKGLLSLGSGGSTRVNITDVGIGTFIEPGTGNGMGGVVASTANAGGNAGFQWATNSVGRYQVTTIGSAGAESLRVYDMNNSAERIRITGIGSVGVGINAPIAQFQVNSTKNAETGRGDARNYHLALRNPADDTGEAIGLSFGITSNAEKVGAAILHERDGGGSQGSLQFYVSSDGNSVSEAMRINSNQNVQFTPEGSTSNPYLLVDSTGDNIRLSSQKSSGDGGLIISTQDSGSSAERARITGVGSFGVGTGGINVESMIHLEKDVNTAYDASATDAQRGGTATLLITNPSTTNNSFAQIAFRNDDNNESLARIAAIKRSTNSSHLAFVTEHGATPAERLRITSDGFIGCGGGSAASNPRGQFVINSEKDANTQTTNPMDPTNYHLVLKNDNDTNNEAIGLCFSASSTVDRTGAAIIHQRDNPGSVGSLKFFTSPSEGTTTERLRFASTGAFGLSGANYGSSGQVLTSQGSSSAPVWSTVGGGKVLQVISSVKVDAGDSNSTGAGSTWEFDDSSLRVQITAANANNVFLILASVTTASSASVHIGLRDNGSNTSLMATNQGSRRAATSGHDQSDSHSASTVPIIGTITAGDTNQHSFYFQFSHTSGSTQTIFLNRGTNDGNGTDRGRYISSIVVMEIEA